MTIRSDLYRVARILGWINALFKGTLPQRAARVLLWRKAGSWINRIR